MDLFPFVRPFMSLLDPETAHRLTIRALRLGAGPRQKRPDPVSLSIDLFGLHFENPLGIAAGFDKNGEVPDAMLAMGMGFAEVGTVTPRPQAGNPRPRVFRLPLHRAVINRLGFNNEGHAACERRMRARAGRKGIVGVNIGANRDSADRTADYRLGVERFAGLASYLAVNISSPNTPGLRDLQARESLAQLLSAVTEARDSHPVTEERTPIFLKIAPDLADAELDDIAAEVLAAGIDGVIVSNTTLARAGLRSRHAGEAGGLSGKPLFTRSTAVLARMRRRLGRDVALIGVGGVDSAQTALEKIRAGADLVQLYTPMIYAGPRLPGKIITNLSALVAREGVGSIAELRDSALEKWEATPL